MEESVGHGTQMNRRWIKTEDELVHLVQRLRGVSRLAVDAEGDGMFRYRTNLCVVQVFDGEQTYFLDTMVMDNLACLQWIMGREGPEKVFHDAAFDVRLFAIRGLALGNVFDTSIAVRFLGLERTGLAAVLEQYLGVTIEKEAQKQDWGKRPLNPSLDEYLASDVEHLLDLRACIAEDLKEKDLMEEVTLETDHMLRHADAEDVMGDDPDPWKRVKGWRTLTPPQLSALQSLCDVREELARSADVAPYRVVSNRALLTLSKVEPTVAEPFRGMRAFRQNQSRWHAAWEQGANSEPRTASTPEPSVEEGLSREDRLSRKALHAQLAQWRQNEADVRGVDVQAVLPTHCLKDMMNQRPETDEELMAIEGFGRKRLLRYGDQLLDLMANVGAPCS